MNNKTKKSKTTNKSIKSIMNVWWLKNENLRHRNRDRKIGIGARYKVNTRGGL